MSIDNITTLHWICNSPSPYNDFLFRYLYNNFGCRLVVHYLNTAGTEHASLLDKDTGYVWRKISSRYFDWVLFTEAAKRDNIFVIGGWNCLLYVLLFVLTAGRYLIWTDTPDSTKQRVGIKNLIRKVVLKLCFAHAKAVMGTGTPALRQLEVMGALENQLVNFPYWVEVPPVKVLQPSDLISILCVGRLEKIKSFDHVVALAERLIQQGMRNFGIQLIGDGSERKNLQQLVENANLQQYVKLVGWLDNDEVLTRMGSCDVFLHPASFEPYGVVILEAMARGRTVIATDMSMAALDRIINGENGYVYPHGDIAKLSGIVSRLAANADFLTETGSAAYRTASDWQVDKALTILGHATGIGQRCVD